MDRCLSALLLFVWWRFCIAFLMVIMLFCCQISALQI